MNHINQGNELRIIPFFSLSRHLLLLDYLCYYYTYEGEKTKTKYKTFHILLILIVMSMTKIIYNHDNKILHVNNSQPKCL